MNKEMNNSKIEIRSYGNPAVEIAVGVTCALASVVLYDVHQVLTRKYHLNKPLGDGVIDHVTKKLHPDADPEIKIVDPDDEDFNPDDFAEVDQDLDEKAHSEVDDLPDRI